LHSNLNRELERVLRSIVKVKNCYSYEVCSHRIEGQFGGEIMELRFSDMNVYHQNSPKTQNYETIKEIVTKCYNLSKKINAGDPIKLRNYLFSNNMKHAEKLIGRILFLQGIPIVSKLKDIHIGSDAAKQLENDHSAEMTAIKTYNAAIKLAGELGDFATREILESILNDEDRHIDEIEELQDQISHMTLPLFLTTQIG